MSVTPPLLHRVRRAPDGQWIVSVLLWLVLVAIVSSRLLAQTGYSTDQRKAFAAALFQRGDVGEAAHEFNRLLLLLPDDAEVQYDLALCFDISGSALWGAADPLFEDVMTASTDSSLIVLAALRLATRRFRRGDYGSSYRLAGSVLPILARRERREERRAAELAYSMLIGSLLEMDSLSTASGQRERIQRQFAGLQGVRISEELIQAHRQVPVRSPLLAVSLSAVVPGLGKVYSGRTGEGLSSLVSSLSTGWLAVRGFDRDGSGSVVGWTFAAIGGVFYLGNLYGTYSTARLFNARARQRLDDRINSWVESSAARVQWRSPGSGWEPEPSRGR